MIKKLIFVAVGILLIVGAFGAGWSLKGKQQNKEYNASIQPAANLVNGIIGGNDVDGQYESTASVYKDSTPKDAFNASAATLKDAIIVNTSTYRGDVDNIISYELTKDGNKSYDAIVTTTKQQDMWQVTSFQISERIQQ